MKKSQEPSAVLWPGGNGGDGVGKGSCICAVL